MKKTTKPPTVLFDVTPPRPTTTPTTGQYVQIDGRLVWQSDAPQRTRRTRRTLDAKNEVRGNAIVAALNDADDPRSPNYLQLQPEPVQAYAHRMNAEAERRSIAAKADAQRRLIETLVALSEDQHYHTTAHGPGRTWIQTPKGGYWEVRTEANASHDIPPRPRKPLIRLSHSDFPALRPEHHNAHRDIVTAHDIVANTHGIDKETQKERVARIRHRLGDQLSTWTTAKTSTPTAFRLWMQRVRRFRFPRRLCNGKRRTTYVKWYASRFPKGTMRKAAAITASHHLFELLLDDADDSPFKGAWQQMERSTLQWARRVCRCRRNGDPLSDQLAEALTDSALDLFVGSIGSGRIVPPSWSIRRCLLSGEASADSNKALRRLMGILGNGSIRMGFRSTEAPPETITTWTPTQEAENNEISRIVDSLTGWDTPLRQVTPGKRKQHGLLKAAIQTLFRTGKIDRVMAAYQKQATAAE